jgi:hypothetical protein
MTGPVSFEQMSRCILTGGHMGDKNVGPPYSYSVEYVGRKFSFTFCQKCFDKVIAGLTNRWHIVRGLILNEKIDGIELKIIHWDSSEPGVDLQKEIEQGIYPRSPKELFNNLFHVLYTKYILGNISYNELKDDDAFAARNFFRSSGELALYFDAMIKDNLFDKVYEGSQFRGRYKITYQGLNFYKEIFEEGYASTKCFVAMAFQNETREIREAIRFAVVATGFEPIFIDEKHVDSEKTINDEIISNLKKCKFCIADFTFHKNGVYFESGFAVGQGKPVIYTCEKEQFKVAHFDIKPLQHIIYDNPGELKEKLIHKIEAWIK